MPLPGSEKYAKPPDNPRRNRWQDEVDKANTIPIQWLFRDFFGSHVPEDLQRSWKTDCPFAFEHYDGGKDKNFRVYQTNTAYCFDVHGMLTPVRLASMHWDLSPVRAARRLEDKYERGHRPYWERMKEMILQQEVAEELKVSPQSAVAALHMRLSQDERYVRRQFDQDVTKATETILEALDEAINSRKPGAVRSWLAESTKKMEGILDATQREAR